MILCSHLCKPKGEPKPELSLAPVAVRLSELLAQEVKFVPSDVVVDDSVKAAVDAMKDGEVIVVDFKFGKKRKAYNKQVKEYMDLLSDMGYEHIRGYLWYVFNNELEEIE